MSDRVYTPGRKQNANPREASAEKKCVCNCLTPEIHWNYGWYEENNQERKLPVVTFLENHNRVVVQISKVESLNGFIDFRKSFCDGPAEVGEHEPAGCVVRIGISIGVFVVDTVIFRPEDDCSLKRVGVEDHQHQTKRPFCLVGTM